MGFFELFAAGLAGLYGLIPSYGLAIILLTICVRLLLLPLSIKQTRSMREMQRIQPDIKALQKKHKGDRQKLNEEMMALYKEHNVNPFGGCLPLLMQFPVFIALYRVLYTPLAYMGYRDANPAKDIVEWVPRQVEGFMETLQESELARALESVPLATNKFLAVFRLDCTPSQVFSGKPSQAVAGVECGSGFVSFLPYLVLILVMGFTTYYQSKQMSANNPAQTEQAAQMQTFAKIMPLLLMFFSFNFPAGLTFYWLTSNLWQIGQQRLMLRVAPPVVHTSGDGVAKGSKEGSKPDTGKPPKGSPRNRTESRNPGASRERARKARSVHLRQARRRGGNERSSR